MGIVSQDYFFISALKSTLARRKLKCYNYYSWAICLLNYLTTNMTDKTPDLNDPGDTLFTWPPIERRVNKQDIRAHYRSGVPPYGTVDISAISTGKPDPKLDPHNEVGHGHPPVDEHFSPELLQSTATGRWVSGVSVPHSIPRNTHAKHTVTYDSPNTHPEDWRATGPTFVTKPIATNTAPAGYDFAVKHDGGKTDWSLMPWECVEEINKVLDFGAKKYAAHNWRTGSGFSYTRVISSLLRHTFAWVRGEDLDPESGLSHLSHMGANVIFLIYYNKYKDRYTNDDRVKS